jgi:hypothetical protein
MSGLRAAISRHPYLAAWFALAVVMVVTLLFAAKDVGLQANHMVALAVATVFLAGGCVWIVSWE